MEADAALVRNSKAPHGGAYLLLSRFKRIDSQLSGETLSGSPAAWRQAWELLAVLQAAQAGRERRTSRCMHR
jgi:hypothetical protein